MIKGKIRVGMGQDVHRLVPGRRLILGGVEIPFDKGLLGHSDADVLVHSICDALLGAAGLGDMGSHFPDTDPAYKDIDSLKILKKTCTMVREKGFEIVNLDSTVFAEAPKLAAYKTGMEKKIARTIEIAFKCVNVKATTCEGLGFIGRGEGIGAATVVMIYRDTKTI